jgi:hypothetical protein
MLSKKYTKTYMKYYFIYLITSPRKILASCSALYTVNLVYYNGIVGNDSGTVTLICYTGISNCVHLSDF